MYKTDRHRAIVRIGPGWPAKEGFDEEQLRECRRLLSAPDRSRRSTAPPETMANFWNHSSTTMITLPSPLWYTGTDQWSSAFAAGSWRTPRMPTMLSRPPFSFSCARPAQSCHEQGSRPGSTASLAGRPAKQGSPLFGGGKEKQLITLPECQAPSRPEIYQELIPLLDQELSRLPEIYRIPIILCDLQERPIAQTARQLGWPQGTLAGRLARGRAMLAKRLTRHGFGLCAVSPAALLTMDSPAMPQALAARVIQTAAHWPSHGTETGIVSLRVASLAKGVLGNMLVSKFVPVAGVILGIVLSTAGLFGYKIAARESDSPVAVVGETQAPVESKPDKPKPPLTLAKEPEQRKPSAKETAANDRLETVLQEWAKADRQIRDVHCELRRIKDDRVYGTKETADGEAWIKRPDLWHMS